jgi:hypothetical protein
MLMGLTASESKIRPSIAPVVMGSNLHSVGILWVPLPNSVMINFFKPKGVNFIFELMLIQNKKVEAILIATFGSTLVDVHNMIILFQCSPA